MTEEISVLLVRHVLVVSSRTSESESFVKLPAFTSTCESLYLTSGMLRSIVVYSAVSGPGTFSFLKIIFSYVGKCHVERVKLSYLALRSNVTAIKKKKNH